MKQGIDVLTLSVISLLSPIVVQSQTVNPSYLSEMPPPARVIAEIKGKDAEDAGERQMGAFIVLVKRSMIWLMDSNTGPNVSLRRTSKGLAWFTSKPIRMSGIR